MPILSNCARILDPWAELGLRELAVGFLETDPIRVARLQVGDENLARELGLPSLWNREVDLDERVRVAIEDGGRAVFLEQLHVLEPVDVLTRRGRVEVDALDQRRVLL